MSKKIKMIDYWYDDSICGTEKLYSYLDRKKAKLNHWLMLSNIEHLEYYKLASNYEQKDYLLVTTDSVLIFKGIAECIEVQNVLIDFFQNEFESDFDIQELYKKRCSRKEHLQ